MPSWVDQPGRDCASWPRYVRLITESALNRGAEGGDMAAKPSIDACFDEGLDPLVRVRMDDGSWRDICSAHRVHGILTRDGVFLPSREPGECQRAAQQREGQ